ncbi:hypothetical protein ACLB2K_067346 [Fragaria x ananassa]
MWMSDRDLSEDTKTKIRTGIKQTKLAEKFIDQPVDLKLICSAGFDALNSLKSCIAMKVLKKVPLFEGVDESSLKHITGYMEPVIYTENSYILEAGGPCTLLLFIVEGVIELTDRTSSNGAETTTKRLQKGDYYGDDMLDSASLNLTLGTGVWALKPSNQDVKCHTKVEAFLTNLRMLDNFLRDYSIRLNDNVKRTVPPNNTDETSNKINMRSKTIKLEEIEESKQMEMKNMELDDGRGEPREGVAVMGPSISSSTIVQRLEQIIQLQGDKLFEQLQILARQNRDDMLTLGRKFDDMAAFLATLGYPGIPSPPGP